MMDFFSDPVTASDLKMYFLGHIEAGIAAVAVLAVAARAVLRSREIETKTKTGRAPVRASPYRQDFAIEPEPAPVPVWHPTTLPPQPYCPRCGSKSSNTSSVTSPIVVSRHDHPDGPDWTCAIAPHFHVRCAFCKASWLEAVPENYGE